MNFIFYITLLPFPFCFCISTNKVTYSFLHGLAWGLRFSVQIFCYFFDYKVIAIMKTTGISLGLLYLTLYILCIAPYLCNDSDHRPNGDFHSHYQCHWTFLCICDNVLHFCISFHFFIGETLFFSQLTIYLASCNRSSHKCFTEI